MAVAVAVATQPARAERLSLAETAALLVQTVRTEPSRVGPAVLLRVPLVRVPMVV
jgi:hypothetical protein